MIDGSLGDVSTPSLLLRGVSLADGRIADVRLRAGRVDTVTETRPGPPHQAGPDGARESEHTQTIDLRGYLLLPAPAEPHAHLDKAYTADVVHNPGGDLDGAVTAWLRHRPRLRQDEIVARASAAARAYLGNGATAIRTHIDLGTDLGLTALTAALAVRENLRGECDLQIVAFAGVPLSGVAGAEHRALLREALAAGADAVGGVPALDPDPVACIDTCLSTAAAHRVPVDLHIDEIADPTVDTLDLLADAVRGSGFPFPVVASHCVSLGVMPVDRARMIVDRVATAGIGVISLPATNLFLQGRDQPVATPRGLTALRALRSAGVTVAAGGDNLQDPFNPMGRADPLETAALMVLAGHDSVGDAYAAVSTWARQLLGLPPVAVVAGAPAELLAVRAGSVREAIATASPDRMVFHGGREVARTWMLRHFAAASHGGSPRGRQARQGRSM